MYVWDMDNYTMKQLIEVSALEAEMQGMIAENKLREHLGLSMAYVGHDFEYIARQMREVSTKYDNERAIK